MACCSGFFSSSIGKKYLIAFTGIFVSLFVTTHMLGNLLLFVGADAYNIYSHKLLEMPFLVPVELFFVALFLTHILYTVSTTWQNRQARGERYALTTSGDKAVTLSSKTMIWQGWIILVFVILHLQNMKWGTLYETEVNGVQMRDLYKLVVELLQMPAYLVWYTLAVAVLGFHLSHGVQSVFQSLGFNHPRYTPWIKRFGVLFGVVIAGGYAAQAIYVFFFVQS